MESFQQHTFKASGRLENIETLSSCMFCMGAPPLLLCTRTCAEEDVHLQNDEQEGWNAHDHFHFPPYFVDAAHCTTTQLDLSV